MVKQCFFCRVVNKYVDIPMHNMPKDPKRRRLWCSSLGIKESDINTKQPFICSRHFEPSQYVNDSLISPSTSKKMLKYNAVPTLIRPEEWNKMFIVSKVLPNDNLLIPSIDTIDSSVKDEVFEEEDVDNDHSEADIYTFPLVENFDSDDAKDMPQLECQENYPDSDSGSSEHLDDKSLVQNSIISQEIKSAIEVTRPDEDDWNVCQDSDKCIAFIGQLRELFQTCRTRGCCQSINANFLEKSGVVFVDWECPDGHSGNWTSQPLVDGRIGQGTLELSAATVATGHTYDIISDVADTMGLRIHSKRMHDEYYQNAANFPCPSIPAIHIKEEVESD